MERYSNEESKMIRAFQNEMRIATAVVLSDKKVLQVYPNKQTFENEEAFKEAYPEHEFRSEVKVKSELTGRMRAAQKHVVAHTSLPRDSDTPMQRIVRQIYYQTYTRDSIRATAKDWLSSYYGSRTDPGIYVQNPDTDIIYPVYFNRTSGLVLFERRAQNDNAPEGLRFYVKKRDNLIPVSPIFEEQQPGQKAVVVELIQYFTERKKLIEQLRQAGFYVIYYLNRWRPSVEVQKAMYRMIPNLTTVLGCNYNHELYVHPSLENLDTPNWWRMTRVDVDKWIAENK